MTGADVGPESGEFPSDAELTRQNLDKAKSVCSQGGIGAKSPRLSSTWVRIEDIPRSR